MIAVVIETTERVQADRRAATERERLLQAFEQAPGFIIAMRGCDHRVEFVNAAHRHVFSSDDWCGRTIREAFPDLEGQGFFEVLDEVFTTGRRYVADATPVTFRQPDGALESRFLTFVYEAMRDADGQIVGVLCEGSDVSASHAAQEALRRSEARFRTALEIRTVGAITFNLDGSLIDANEAFLTMSGYSRADLEDGGLSLQSLTAPEWRGVVDKTLADLEREVETAPGEKEYLRRDGTRWWGLFAAKRLQDGVGFKFVIDITEQKQAEFALLERTSALEALNRTAAMTAIERDLDRVVQTVTDAGVELSGAEYGAFFYNVDDPTGERYMLYALSGAPKNAFAHFPMPRITDVFSPTFRGEGSVRSDDIKRDPRYGRNAPLHGMPPGHLPISSYLAAPVVSRSGEVLGALLFGHSAEGMFAEAHERRVAGLAAQAAIAIDNARLFHAVQAANETLEERVHQRTQELTEAHEALRQAQKMEAVGQLTGGIAHDFNNLLMGISGSLELIERGLARHGVTGLERYVHGAQASARRAASLTQRLLAFSRRQTLDPKPTDINRLIFGLEDMIRRTVGPSIEVEVVGQAGLWAARIDAAQLENALLNLAINARDAMPDGGRITIETANKWLDDRGARERELKPGQYLSICVTDTGAGIPKDIVDRIFDPFFTTKPIGEGGEPLGDRQVAPLRPWGGDDQRRGCRSRGGRRLGPGFRQSPHRRLLGRHRGTRRGDPAAASERRRCRATARGRPALCHPAAPLQAQRFRRRARRLVVPGRDVETLGGDDRQARRGAERGHAGPRHHQAWGVHRPGAARTAPGREPCHAGALGRGACRSHRQTKTQLTSTGRIGPWRSKAGADRYNRLMLVTGPAPAASMRCRASASGSDPTAMA